MQRTIMKTGKIWHDQPKSRAVGQNFAHAEEPFPVSAGPDGEGEVKASTLDARLASYTLDVGKVSAVCLIVAAASRLVPLKFNMMETVTAWSSMGTREILLPWWGREFHNVFSASNSW